MARNAGGASTSSPANLSVVAAAPPEVGRLVNMAIRTQAGTGAQTLTVGFAVGGSGASTAAPLLVRAVGPSLSQFGLAGVLTDPVATLFQGTTAISTNNNWVGADIASRATAVGAFPLSVGSLDAALAAAPVPQSYTVQITSNNDGTGIVLAEIYDATRATTITAGSARLVNVSARAQVGSGSDLLIAGFAIGGTTARTVLIRAIGPALASFGVTGTLADPRLHVFSGATLVHENDNSPGAELEGVLNSVGAFALARGTGRDAAILVTLPPGAYTAQVSGHANSTGVALVEIYDVP